MSSSAPDVPLELPGWSHDALVDEVRRAPRDARPWCDDTRLVASPDWYQLLTPSSRTAVLNEVMWSRIREADPEPLIDRVFAAYRAQGSGFKWCLMPGVLPGDLGARLAARGGAPWWARGMVADARALASTIPVARGVDVSEITDLRALDTWLDTMGRAWEVDVEILRAPYRRAFASGAPRVRLFLATLDGVPAATGGLFVHQRSGYLIGGAVIAAHRNRSLYQALVRARLAAITAHGLDLATTHAREATSAPILERLGFRTVFRYQVYLFPAPAPD